MGSLTPRARERRRETGERERRTIYSISQEGTGKHEEGAAERRGSRNVEDVGGGCMNHDADGADAPSTMGRYYIHAGKTMQCNRSGLERDGRKYNECEGAHRRCDDG
jgi:hypothetical protein